MNDFNVSLQEAGSELREHSLDQLHIYRLLKELELGKLCFTHVLERSSSALVMISVSIMLTVGLPCTSSISSLYSRSSFNLRLGGLIRQLSSHSMAMIPAISSRQTAYPALMIPSSSLLREASMQYSSKKFFPSSSS